MYIECHFDASSGAILSVWEAGHQPFPDPADGWKPFSVPVDPATGQPLLAADGTPDAAQLAPNYAIAKIDLDYATQLAIDQGAYNARASRSAWIMANLRIDLASLKDGPQQAGCVRTARLVPRSQE